MRAELRAAPGEARDIRDDESARERLSRMDRERRQAARPGADRCGEARDLRVEGVGGDLSIKRDHGVAIGLICGEDDDHPGTAGGPDDPGVVHDPVEITGLVREARAVGKSGAQPVIHALPIEDADHLRARVCGHHGAAKQSEEQPRHVRAGRGVVVDPLVVGVVVVEPRVGEADGRHRRVDRVRAKQPDECVGRGVVAHRDHPLDRVTDRDAVAFSGSIAADPDRARVQG